MNASADTQQWRPLPRDFDHPERGTELSPRVCRRWQLVLTAMGIASRVEPLRQGHELQVPDTLFVAALEQLRRYELENRGWPPPLPAAIREQGSLLVTLSVVVLAASFYNLTRHAIPLPGQAAPDWYSCGMLYAGKVRAGELWRLVTALTLHADALHIAGNGVVTVLFVERLRKVYGSGLTWVLFLASGASGNLVNALLQPYHHQAVGASTAVFGLLGVIATDTLIRYRQALWRRWAMPLAAACALLGLLGTAGEHTDLGAHLWGFACGLPLGLLLARFAPPSPSFGGWSNRLLAAAALAVVAGAWALALGPCALPG